MNSVGGQLSRHSVALVSLLVALSSLSYNTWRNELTEANRNVRVAGVEVLLKLGELEQVVFFSHYDRDRERGNPRIGWAYALTIRDLASLMPEPAVRSSLALFDSWDANWSGLGSDQAAADRISASIDEARNEVLAILAALD